MREKFSGIRALAMFAVCSLCILSATAAQGATVSVLNTTPSQCPALQPLLEDLKTVQFPSDWTVYVACDIGTWQAVLRKADVRLTDAALTDRAHKLTIINGAMYSPSFSFDAYTQKTPERVLRHELGHIICNTSKEEIADRYADRGSCK